MIPIEDLTDITLAIEDTDEDDEDDEEDLTDVTLAIEKVIKRWKLSFKWWKLSSDESYLVMTISSDGSYLVMKVI